MAAPPTYHLQDIPDEGLSLDLPLDAQWLAEVVREHGYTPVGGKRARAKLRLDLDGRDVLVSGEVEATLQAQCVACLEPVEIPLRTEFQLHLEPKPAGKPTRHAEVELAPGELDVDWYTDDKIDLAHWLREQLLLEAPVHPRHEGDCPVALRPPAPDTESQPREIDPRLLPLRKFVKKE